MVRRLRPKSTVAELQGPGENGSIHRKNGTDCVGANAKKKKKRMDVDTSSCLHVSPDHTTAKSCCDS